MTNFREVLRPAAWMYVAAAMIIPTVILTMAPFNMVLGIVVGIALYLVIVIAMVLSSPTIVLTETELRVGPAHIDRSLVGAVSAYSGSHAVNARGPGLDARAWLYLRGWINPVVRVDIADPSDPTPYWLFSTRRPEELAAALRQRS